MRVRHAIGTREGEERDRARVGGEAVEQAAARRRARRHGEEQHRARRVAAQEPRAWLGVGFGFGFGFGFGLGVGFGLGLGLGLGSMSSVSTCMVPPSLGESMSQRAFPSRREVKPTLKALSPFCTSTLKVALSHTCARAARSHCSRYREIQGDVGEI